MNNMNKNKRIAVIAIVVIILLVIIGYFTGFLGNRNDYSIVYLASSEIYVGKVRTFPVFQLKDAYIFRVIQDEKDPEKSNFSLVPVSEALWAPEKLYINKDQILFHGLLLETSSIAKTLAEQGK